MPNGVDLSQPLPSHRPEMANQTTTATSNNVSLNPSDFFGLASVRPQDPLKSSVPFKDGGVGSPNPFDATPETFADPFTSPSGEAELFLPQHPVVTNPFHQAAASEADLFQAFKQDPPIKDLFSPSLVTEEDVFSPLSVQAPQPFPRTVTRDLLLDFSGSEEPYTNTASGQYNSTITGVSDGTPDIFQPLPKDTAIRSYPAPVLSVPPGGSGTEPSVVLATPRGNKHDIFQATPFIQARSLSESSGQSSPEMTRVCIMVVVIRTKSSSFIQLLKNPCELSRFLSNSKTFLTLFHFITLRYRLSSVSRIYFHDEDKRGRQILPPPRKRSPQWQQSPPCH